MALVGGCASDPGTPERAPEAAQAGEIYDTATGRRISEAELIASLQQAKFVLLGEKHDNPDHHVNQAALVAGLGGRVSAVVFEMMGADQQIAIVEHLAADPGDSEGLGAALAWSESGWPDWTYYEPIVAAALDAEAQIVAGNVPGPVVKSIYQDGLAALPPGLVRRTALDRPLEPSSQEGLSEILIASHCGHATDEMLPSMLLVQRARDATMADRLARLAGNGIGVLIAGSGHVRNDWGVPLYLERLAPGRRVASVAMVEVGSPDAGAIEDLPFDYVWLTPRSEPGGEDPCDAFKDSARQS